MSIHGSVEFTLDCKSKEIEVINADHFYFARHVKRNVSVMCYKDDGKYNINMKFERGGIEQNLMARQPNRFMKQDIKVAQL